jgi:hypothetical protein
LRAFRLRVSLLLIVVLLIPATTLGQCKWECIYGTDQGTNLPFAECVEHPEQGIFDLNTCRSVDRCIRFLGGSLCYPDCDGEWCYQV